MRGRSAKQITASRANLIKARAKRRRIAGGILAVGVGAAAIYGGSKVSGHPVKVTSFTPPKARQAVSPHRVRGGAFKKANYPHTSEAKAHANIRYRHTNVRSRGISEAEVMRRTGSYSAIRGKKISTTERSAAMKKYRKQMI